MSIVQLLFIFTKISKSMFGERFTQFFLDLIVRERKFYCIDQIYDFDKKKAITRLTLLLPGKGCSWALKTGGCTMCGFTQEVREIGKKFKDKDLMTLYRIAELMTLKNKPLMLAIYNAGSFINDDEISLKVQKELCQKVRNHSTIEKLFIESRAEFVTENRIKTLKNILGNKKLIVGMGLEAQDDKIRNVYIHKGLTKETYEKAIRTIKKNGGKSLAYVFIKPIFLNEGEAIEEAVNTAKYAFEVGTDEVAFESAFIQKNTKMEQMFREKKFTPPWLWSIIEVVKRTYFLDHIHLGGFQDNPPPIATPANCDQCTEKIKKIFQRFRETNEIKLFDNLDCNCKKDWERIIKS